MEEGIKLTDLEKDALKESANIGAGNASSALSELVKKKVNIVVSDLSFISLDNLQEAIGGPKQLVVGIYTPVSGGMSGTIIIIFPIDCALALSSVLQGKPKTASSTLSEEDKGVLGNMGNILSESYLASLDQLLEMGMKRGESKIVSTFGESVIDLIMLSIDEESKSGLLIKTNFDIEETDIEGQFVLLLATKKIDDVLAKIREKIS